LEVLLHGFRLYPDSDDLAARRAWYYFDRCLDDAAGQNVRVNGSGQLLWELLRVRLEHTDDKESQRRLEELLEAHPDMDDEEIIQFVDCASSVNVYEWLKNRLPELRRHCSYLPTLLYEMQAVAGINNDNTSRIKFLEELTDITPFEADIWCQLSEAQLADGNAAEAESSADYAMAISPVDPRPILSKCRAIISQDRDYDKVIAMLENMTPDPEDESAYTQMLAVAYVNENRMDDARRVLMNCNEKHPADRAIVDYLLLLRHDKACDVLDSFYVATPDQTEDAWLAWANSHSDQGHYAQAALILECFDRNAGIEEHIPAYISALYAAGFYMVIVHLFNAALETDIPSAMSPELGLAGVLSMLRLGWRNRAFESARKLRTTVIAHKRWGMDRVLASVG
ncbi:MAG: hypothetical protein K2M76_02120, partial [Muribaculaceae bacterium]|nr:hypothetical protein [Muribaculaceae bacterium]